MFESINGAGFGLGFFTSLVGAVSAGSTSVTIADGTTFCSPSFASLISQPCNEIIIVGAGTGGANLKTFITGGGIPAAPLPGQNVARPYTVTISPAVVTSVIDPMVLPYRDINGALTIEHAEMDGGQYFLNAQGNASGDVIPLRTPRYSTLTTAA